MFLTKSGDLSLEISNNNSFNFEDNITCTEEEFPSDIVFPHSLNKFLRKKIHEITSENGCLQKSLQDVEEKLEMLKSSTSSILTKTENNLNPKEVIQQSEINAVYNIESNTFSKNAILNLKKQLSRKNERIQILNEKVNQATDEISVLKDINLSLKQEVTKSQKASSYRKTVDHDLRNLEKKRKQQIETLTTESKQLENTLENMKTKLSASKARITMLENELDGAKKNIALLNEKKIHNDHVIEELNNELKSANSQLLNCEVDIKNKKSKWNREKDILKNELESLQIQNNLLRRKLEELKTEI